MKVTYDAEAAKAYGIPAAIMLAKIAYLQRFSKRPDGFCWKKADEIEEETGLSPKQQRHALARLEVAGLIEVKATRAGKGAQHVRHFRLTEEGEKVAGQKCQKVTFESDKRSLLKSDKRSLSSNIELNTYRNNTRASSGPVGSGRAARGRKEQQEREAALEAQWAKEWEERRKAAGLEVLEGGKAE